MSIFQWRSPPIANLSHFLGREWEWGRGAVTVSRLVLLSAQLMTCRHREVSSILKRHVRCPHVVLCSSPECDIRLLEALKKNPKLQIQPHFSP